jgi:hypothetical protein
MQVPEAPKVKTAANTSFLQYRRQSNNSADYRYFTLEQQ